MLEKYEQKWSHILNGSRWLFPKYDEDEQVGLERVSRYWLRWCKEQKIPPSQYFRAHSGRVTFVNLSIAAKIPDRLIAITMNWRDVENVSGYNVNRARGPEGPARILANLPSSERDAMLQPSMDTSFTM